MSHIYHMFMHHLSTYALYIQRARLKKFFFAILKEEKFTCMIWADQPLSTFHAIPSRDLSIDIYD
jgi:hypothetical protein